MQFQDRGMGVLGAIRYLMYTAIAIYFILVFNKLLEFDIALFGIALLIVLLLNYD
jgi:hypothetical protein